ncbi:MULTISPECIES: hypothetical protein [unclassified Nostoc]|uniref:hypothetical protein n=1 Tax=unclassified Nostoc TaxID=2593658 RepID=UPI002AD43E2D|nr:hypothetical protein [Nostoc sp. DedQUE03]MDZ7975932.1 hypothetical protein [Nostoc sp. DedQUE03]MDZ8044767.1 hypothetical protein [Nostoc sp. DedQUE02]
MLDDFLIEAAKLLGFKVLLFLVKEGLKLFSQRNNTRNLIPDIYGVDLLRVILKERYVQSQQIIDIFGTEEKLNSILSGQQELTIGQIQNLSKRFLISPMAFYPLGNS